MKKIFVSNSKIEFYKKYGYLQNLWILNIFLTKFSTIDKPNISQAFFYYQILQSHYPNHPFYKLPNYSYF